MNHRSNMDYMLAGFLAADQAALSYAVGEWARIWPLSALIRAMGAYFVRRNSRDELYRRVLERYIAMATEAGVPQAVFPEGGLTRDGRMREPKLGVLDYMLRGFSHRGERDLVFVPLGLNYDRVLEDRTLLARSNQSATGNSSGRVWNTCRFVVHNLWLMLKQRVAPLRLRLRQFRHADLDARVLRRARHRFPGAFRRGAARRRGRSRRELMAGGRPDRAGGAGAADRRACSWRTRSARFPSSSSRPRSGGSSSASKPPARTCTSRARDLDYALDRRPAHAAPAPPGRGGGRAVLGAAEEMPLLRYYANSIAHFGRQGETREVPAPLAVA